MSENEQRPETPEESHARLTPPPFSLTYRDGFPWVRPGEERTQEVADTTEAQTGAAEGATARTSGTHAAAADTETAPVTARDVSETAMRAVTEIDSAIASLQAIREQLLAGIGHVAVDDACEEYLDPGIGLRDVAAELALMQRRSDRTLQAELNHAMVQTEHWPAAVRAWGQARIHRGHVAVIGEIGASLRDPAARAAFEAALLPHAERVNPGRLRAIARRELERHQPEPIAARHQRARDRRTVTVSDADDGMSWISALVPTVLAHGALDRLTQMAKAAPADDPRRFDQRRADAFCDLLLTGEPTDTALTGIRADVTIIMPAPMLADTDTNTNTPTDTGTGASSDAAVARLAGGAALDPATARLLAEQATAWTRLFTDPLTGHVTAVDTYTPSVRLKRLLRARDQRCRWPGCTANAARSDIDHTIPWVDGGTTDTGNLAHLCRRHHTLKGAKLSRARRWKLRQTSPGILEFTSPTGATYIDEPPPVGPSFEPQQPDTYWGTRQGPLTREQAAAWAPPEF